MAKKNQAGGTAAESGLDYQKSVCAWICSHIIADLEINDLEKPAKPIAVSMETGQAVDDIWIGLEGGNTLLCQVKRTVSLSDLVSSTLGEAIQQFVHQYESQKTFVLDKKQRSDKLDAFRDRFLLIVGKSSTGPVKNDLRNVLKKIRTLSSGQDITSAANTEKETDALNKIIKLIASAAKPNTSRDIIRDILTFIEVLPLETEDQEVQDGRAKEILQNRVVKDPKENLTAHQLLVELSSNMIKQRTGRTRIQLQQYLVDNLIDLKWLQSYAEDIEKLRENTETTIASLEKLSHLTVAGENVRITRSFEADLLQAAQLDSLLIIGDPGSGKSGALYWLMTEIQKMKADIVAISIDQIAFQSMGELRTELNINTNLDAILINWLGTTSGYLFIDGVDAARNGKTLQTIHDLIRSIVTSAPRWRVIASVRSFDLQYNEQLKELFKGSPPNMAYCREDFRKEKHFLIPRLTDKEIDQLKISATDLWKLFGSARPELQSVLRNPFYFKLMQNLLEHGANPEALKEIRHEIELLELFWRFRVLATENADDRERVLRNACQLMIDKESLQADRLEAIGQANGARLNELLSNAVLVELPKRREVISFSHNVLFDFAVAWLILRSPSKSVADRIVENPDLVLMIRPSLNIYFTWLWYLDADKASFWKEALAISRDRNVSKLVPTITANVVAELSEDIDDFEILLKELENGR